MGTNSLVQNKVQNGGGGYLNSININSINNYSFSCAIKWIE